MITIKEIAWLAGLVEGEGCISYYNSVQIRINMTDKDVVEEIGRLWNRPIHLSPNPNGYKQQYTVAICGSAAIGWLLTLYTLLKSRRRAKALEAINKWKIGSAHKVKKYVTFNCGHPKTNSNIYYRGRYLKCRECGL